MKSAAWAMRETAKEADDSGDRDTAIHCRGVAEGLEIAWRGLITHRINQRAHLSVVK